MKASVIESVVTITQQRDISALESCLLDELIDILDGIEEASLYSIEEEAEQWLCHEICFRSNSSVLKGHGKGIKQDLLQQLDATKEPILSSIDGGRQCLLVPIIQNKKTVAVLQIIAEIIGDEFQYMVKALGRIYGNFTSILIESEKDKLTGLFNRKTFEMQLKRLLSNQIIPEYVLSDPERRKSNHGQHAWLAMMDIDYFKKVNDKYGHIYGDEVLLIFSRLMRQVFRNNDLLFRFGGEEFVVILEPITVLDAMAALERFRKTIANYSFPQVGHVSVSIGFAKITPEDYPLNVLNFADKALYYAKENGRNQVFNYEELVDKKMIEPLEHLTGDIEIF